VGLLDVHGDGGGDDDVVVAEGAHEATVVAGEADGGDAGFLCDVEGFDDVFGVAGGGDAEEDVAGLAEGFELAGEDVVEAEVVAGGGEDGGVGGEGDGAEGGAVDGEADDELGDEMLGVCGGASVAGDEELVAGVHGAGGEFGDGDEGVGDSFVGEDGLHGGDGLSELSLDEVLHGFSGGCLVLMQGYGMGVGDVDDASCGVAADAAMLLDGDTGFVRRVCEACFEWGCACSGVGWCGLWAGGWSACDGGFGSGR
jgi:hypothetical protein